MIAAVSGIGRRGARTGAAWQYQCDPRNSAASADETTK
jgi:hypothetical protein